MQRRSSSRSLLVAALLSLLLHLLLFGWIATRPPRPPPPPANAPVELVVIEVPDAPEPPQPAEDQPEPAPRSNPPPERVAEPAPESGSSPEHIADAPTLPTAPEAPRAPRGGDWLLPRAKIVDRLDAVPDAGVDVPSGLQGLDARGADAVVRELADQTIGRDRVQRGLVHGWYGELGKALLKTWDADRAVSRRGLNGYFEQMEENSRAWNKIWMEHAEQFGKSGSLHGTETEAPPTFERRPIGDQNLAMRRAVRQQMRNEYRATKKATVRVVQDANGKLLTVELVSPSNDRAVDREALTDIRNAAERLPRPPEEVIGGRDKVVSLWQFELIVSISPPVPSLRFEFDEALGFVDPRLPLDRRIYKRVKLIAVE